MNAPTEHVISAIEGAACEVEYRDANGNVVGVWAYGSFDPSYPYQGQVQGIDRIKIQEKMQSLMYHLTKEAARSSYHDFLENLEINEDEYEEIKRIWAEKLGIKPYV